MQDFEAVDAEATAAIVTLQKFFLGCDAAIVDMNVVALLDVLSDSFAVFDVPY